MVDMKELHTDVLALKVVVTALATRLNHDGEFIAAAKAELSRLSASTLDAQQRDALTETVKELIYG